MYKSVARSKGRFLVSTFSKNFKNKNQSQGFIPKLILDNLNSELKNNLEYVYCGEI